MRVICTGLFLSNAKTGCNSLSSHSRSRCKLFIYSNHQPIVQSQCWHRGRGYSRQSFTSGSSLLSSAEPHLRQDLHFPSYYISQVHDKRSKSTHILSKNQTLQATMAATQQGATAKVTQQKFDYFLVLDFEATCDNNQRLNPQEIIEFPVLKVNARTHKIDSTFHEYVLPQYHPQLTPFCTELTGIIQDMVDNQAHLPQVLQNFDQWMLSEGLLEPDCKSIFVTCGDWDLKTMLPKQSAVLDLAPKYYFRKWINIKKSYADVFRTFPKGMMDMLRQLNLKHVGRHHSGIDDCHNIANILIALLQRGYIFKENGRLY